MKKKLIKLLVISLITSLMVGLIGSFALAVQKKLTSYEWLQLPAKDKMKYRTVVIRPFTREGEIWSENTRKIIKEKFDECFECCYLGLPLNWYSANLFMLKHPEVKFEEGVFVDQTDAGMVALASGKAQSFLMEWAFTSIRDGVKLGVFADITDLVKDWDQTPIIREKVGNLWDSAWIDGRCYGIPQEYVYPVELAIRKDWCKDAGIFDEKGRPMPPMNWSWNDLREIALKLTNSKKKRWGLGTCVADLEAKGSDLFAQASYSFGSLDPWGWAIPDKSGKYTWRFGITPPVVQSLQFFKDMMWKDKSVLINKGKGWNAFWTDFMGSGRVGIVCGGNYSRVFGINSPFHPDRKATEDIGYICYPRGEKTDIQINNYTVDNIGFLASMDKEQLKLAFEFQDWLMCGKGLQLWMQRDADLYEILGEENWRPNMHAVNMYIRDGYKKRFEIPANFKKGVDKLIPEYCWELNEYMKKIPRSPLPNSFGFTISRLGIKAEIPYLNKLYQAIMSDPNADVLSELKKVEDPINQECFSYKIEGDKEKFKDYYTAYAEFYKEYYPKFYESKLFKEMWEKYYKVW